MATYFYIRLQDSLPIERSTAIEAEEAPELLEGWDAVWTLEEWNNYIASIPIPESITPETATQVSDFYDMTIDNYQYFRTHLEALVATLGEGDVEIGFDTLNATEAEFVALNAIGSNAQIVSTLSEPSKQTIDFLISKQLL